MAHGQRARYEHICILVARDALVEVGASRVVGSSREGVYYGRLEGYAGDRHQLSGTT